MSFDLESKKLREVIELVIDNRGRNPEEYSSEGIPVIDNYLITSDGQVNLKEVNRFIDDHTYNTFLRKYVQYGDVLMTLVGNGYGKVAITPNEKCAIIQNTVGFRCNSKNSNKFLYYLLRCNREIFMNLNRGAAQPSIKVGDILDLEFQFPSKEYQDQVANILGSLDDRIALLRETNATLEAIAQALFKSWFVDFDPVHANAGTQAPSLPPEIQALFPATFTDSPQGLIPEGWSWKTLDEAYEINPKRLLKKGALAKYLDMASVQTQGHVTEDVIERAFGSGTKFCNGDTLLARITPCLENGKTAFVDFLEPNETGWGSTEFVILKPKAPLPDFHGYLLARQSVFREFAIRSMSGTSGRQRVQNDVLGSFYLAIPDESIAAAFAQIVTPIQQSISANHKQAKTLAALRDTLLPRLISGKLRLPDAQVILEEDIYAAK